MKLPIGIDASIFYNSDVRRVLDAVSPIATLVVDDNGPYRAELIEYLRTQEGITIVGEAADGFEAILMAQALEPDLVLMDISMPGVGGLEAARVIKEQHAKVKVVLVTIHEEKTYRQLAQVIHTDGFICKSSVTKDFPKVLKKIRNELVVASKTWSNLEGHVKGGLL